MAQGEGTVDEATRRPRALAPLAQRRPALGLVLLFVAFAGLDLAVYRGALHGEFVSDDVGYLVTHPYTASLDSENVWVILDPFGPAKLYTANYAPVHLLLHALERQIFAEDVFGFHLVNVLVHALNATLLVALLLGSRLPPAAAILGGTLFAVHPANVEAVAWVSQLKTNGALALCFAALLVHRQRPLLSTPLFALALLTKASAFAALPMAAAFTWARKGGPGGSERHGLALGLWVALFALYAVPQSLSFAHLGGVEEPAYADRGVHLRSIAAVGSRYLAMAATSYGVSAFQEPDPVRSNVDPWWLAALPLGALLLWRTGVTLRRRSEEAAYWVGAAASFAPVSQVFPFVHPIADRYLYFILPGLIGGALFWAVEIGSRAATARGRPAPSTRALGGGALALGALLAAFFAVHSAARAKLWRNETLLLVDAAAHYPAGGTARLLGARRAAQAGDVDTAVHELRAAVGRGVDSFMHLMSDPGLAPIADEPAFVALVREVAGLWIERAHERGTTTQAELRMLAHAHLVREEYDRAADSLERALQAGGPQELVVRTELEAVRARLATRERDAEGGEAQGTNRHRAQRP